MKIHYDKKQDALYIRFNNNSYKESDEVKEGVIFDYDDKNKIIGIEILDASFRLSKKFKPKIEKREPLFKSVSKSSPKNKKSISLPKK